MAESRGRLPPPERSRASVVVIEEALVIGNATESPGGDTPDDDAPEKPGGVKTWSDRGGLADKDFAAFTTDEIAAAARGAVASRLEPR